MPIPASLDVFLIESLPNALLTAYEWVREWQTLLAAVLLIFALGHFCRAIIEAFGNLAEVVIRSTRISAVISSSRAIPSNRETRELARPRSHAGEKLSQARSSTDLLGRLDALRNAIRVALAAIPPTQNKIDEKGLKLYSNIAVMSFGDVGDVLSDQESRDLGQELEGALTELRCETGNGLDPRLVWESLARVNRLARALQIKASSSNGAAIDRKGLEEAG
jgi:hypothetical protein